ncbi:hypothetical protein NEOLEDRAFT_1173436 [Neolentinus lepideus HHB14362 ss-1]|uniref:GmrSD restriction endonucleases N-terminal domain-containing protein n=1 Tax=Neolentinus lepideus HHB14362 ss-1 TaxID=1314782 RepID=A0A165MT92_9AGAM|nr:hypothetical protein NEOLEDRAFT_1173436 [Neolentinus lepideus HHB14362 ss-1]
MSSIRPCKAVELEDGQLQEMSAAPQNVAMHGAIKPLKSPRITSSPTQLIVAACPDHLIDRANASGMTDNIWSEQKQCNMIDSIFRNIHVPAFVFAVNVDEDGSERKTCIDGKQRLTALYNFMNGLIPYIDPVTHEKLWYKLDHEEPHRKLLPESLQRRFANKQLQCVEYQDISVADERMIFERLQMGMSVSYAEKLQMISSARATLVREILQDHFAHTDWISASCSSWDDRRGGNFRCVAQMLYHIEKYPAPDRMVTSFELERWLTADHSPLANFRVRITETFTVLQKLGNYDKLKTCFASQKLTLAELVMVVLVVAVFRRRMHVEDIVDVVCDMRQRSQSRDGTQTTAMLNFIKNVNIRVSDIHTGPAGLAYDPSLLKACLSTVRSPADEGAKAGICDTGHIIPYDDFVQPTGFTAMAGMSPVPTDKNLPDESPRGSHPVVMHLGDKMMSPVDRHDDSVTLLPTVPPTEGRQCSPDGALRTMHLTSDSLFTSTGDAVMDTSTFGVPYDESLQCTVATTRHVLP